MLSRFLRHRSSLYLLSALLLFGGALVAWNNGVRNRIFPKRFGVVREGLLYRSGQISSGLIEKTLRQHKIRRIVALGTDIRHNADEEAEKKAADALGIQRVVYPLSGDGTGDIGSYVEAVTAMVRARDAGEPLLVHCTAGTQRTGGVVAYYRLLLENASPSVAVAELRRYGWDPDDNPKLLPYLNGHMLELATRLRDRGILQRVPEPLPQLVP